MRCPIAISTCLLLTAACGPRDPLPTEPAHSEAVARPAKGKPAPDIALIVTVADAPNLLQSDGQGDYVDGVQSVEAILDGVGNLMFNPHPGVGGRTLFMDFTQQATGAPYTVDVSGVTILQVLASSFRS